MTGLLIGLILMTAAADEHRFTVPVAGEAVATVTAGCDACDWAISGQEAVLARVSLDGTYSQHLLISRGAAPVPYRILLGPLAAGEHRLVIERDTARSAKNAGAMKIERVEVRAYAAGTPEHEWLAQAPFVHARPGTVERFSDLPIHAWAERAPAPAVGFRYSIIFSHEDGGTPTDRLMATWGRTTDVEFVYGTERTPDGVLHQEIQARNHDILPFAGRRLGSHPLLWVSTENNMVSDTGPEDAVRFGVAPEFVALENVVARGRDGQEPVDLRGDVGGAARAKDASIRPASPARRKFLIRDGSRISKPAASSSTRRLRSTSASRRQVARRSGSPAIAATTASGSRAAVASAPPCRLQMASTPNRFRPCACAPTPVRVATSSRSCRPVPGA